MDLAGEEQAFPTLSAAEMDAVRGVGRCQRYVDGETVFRAGDTDIDFFVVESGELEVLNPTGGHSRVTVHRAREFAGDIDLLTRRPVVVTAIARGETVLLRASGAQLRQMLNSLPRLGEKLITAFHIRRELLQRAGVAGVRVIGEPRSPETTLIREFLHRNFVPYTWHDSSSPEGKAQLHRVMGRQCPTPIVECPDGEVLCCPSVATLARKVGLQQPCPDQVFDVAVVGAGPAGMTAAVYAASEGLSTIVLDALGPGGQAGGSSMIENFIGFPSGLSGTELATRGVLQMLKFGALLLTPVRVSCLRPGDDQHYLCSDDGQTIQAHSILIATGIRWRGLDVPGAERFERAGMYYAATAVEARVCSGQEILVVGAGNSGGQAAMFLSECSPRVHLIVHNDDLCKGMSAYLADRIRQNGRITLHPNTEVTAIEGESRITGARITDLETHEVSCLPCAAVFVFIGGQPNTAWLPPEVIRNDDGYILTGADVERSGRWPLTARQPCPLETSVPGVIAAGDVRAGGTKRVAFAVGDGAMAVTCIHRLRH